MVKILHFEDDVTFAAYFDEALRRASFDVVHFSVPPKDVVGLVVEEKPDILVTDVLMPRVDGFTLATLLKHDARTKDIPIVFLTSFSGMEYRAQGKQAGADLYFVKREVDVESFIHSLLSLIFQKTI